MFVGKRNFIVSEMEILSFVIIFSTINLIHPFSPPIHHQQQPLSFPTTLLPHQHKGSSPSFPLELPYSFSSPSPLPVDADGALPPLLPSPSQGALPSHPHLGERPLLLQQARASIFPSLYCSKQQPCSSLQWCIFHEDWSSPSLPASLGFVGDQDFLREAIKAT
ncbi:hypothetical protein SORBI_3008G088815 [Sorghum bicolor]|uniref:Uncharacterized protein n=1 Tax=Sorghum bicolor TaxID=4558 RepID=A0A1Z5R5M4_SORBI|nr:hypothetical protein SORBI_3008G088815 [Sorghum bicolor]